MGLNGGGRFEVASDTSGFSYGDGGFPPETGSWYYLCVTMNSAGFMTMNAVQDSRSWNASYVVSSNANMYRARAAHTVTLGRRSQGDYQYRHLISNVRLTNRVLLAAEMNKFPLNVLPESVLCVQGSPSTNLADGTPMVLQAPGGVFVSQHLSPLGSYIP